MWLPRRYRPIALFCFLSKVVEKLAHDQIVGFLEEGSLLDSLQTGFRKFNSTQTALIKLTDDIRMEIDRKMVTFFLLFDFSKAFDTIPSSKLLVKLGNIGFSRGALLWVKTYLQDQSQCVAPKLQTSDCLSTNLGVPQGSVLEPLLFCLYVNDLKDKLDVKNIFQIFYADDLQIYVQVPIDRVREGLFQLLNAAQLVAAWADQLGIKLNSRKMQAIFFGSSGYVQRRRAMNLPGVSLKPGSMVPFASSVKSLGVMLDSTLSWRPQIDSVTKM